MFPEWISKADFTYMLEAGDMISIEPTYCLMPESSGLVILDNIEKICVWLFKNLEATVRLINPNLEVDWTRLSIFGESFGGLLAIALYIETGRQLSKPPDLRIRGIVLRCPLSEEYKREAGPYCGTFIPYERAKHACEEISETMKKMPWIVRRASTNPPRGMFVAYAASVSGCWKEYWKADTAPEMIQKAPQCPDPQTAVRIMHGTGDHHVPHDSSVRLAGIFERNWPSVKVELILEPGEGHAWDRSKPLEPDYRRFLGTL